MIKPYYQDEWATIYHCDCREVLPYLDPVDLVLTDPPYGIHLGKTDVTAYRGSYASFDDTPEIVIPLVREVLEMCERLTGRVVITPGVANIFNYPKPTWVGSFYYPTGAGSCVWGFACWQPVFYYGKDPHGGKGRYSDSFSSSEKAEKNGHPCPKPIGQWKKLLKRVSLPGETVLDPFMGSGTTLRAAKDLAIKSIGIEIEEKYCEIAVRRLRQESLLGLIHKEGK